MRKQLARLSNELAQNKVMMQDIAALRAELAEAHQAQIVSQKPPRSASLKKRRAKSGKLNVGQRVEARYNGENEWFRGQVTAVKKGGMYTITYDDGDSEKRVGRKLIRLLDQAADDDEDEEEAVVDEPAGGVKRFGKGQEVDARFEGGEEWFPGVIVRVGKRNTYTVAYDDGDTEASARWRDRTYI